MIFVTVGEQLPFDRLIKAVDGCAMELDCDVFAQIGDTPLCPQNISYEKFIDPFEFNRKFDDAHLIIGHAGMGTIITALEMAKPVIIMPRLASLGEHRNDHQLATSKRFEALENVTVVAEVSELQDAVLSLYSEGGASTGGGSKGADQTLLNAIRDFVQN